MSPSTLGHAKPAPDAKSVEMRAQLIADSVGKISDGDPRKRVFDMAVVQIREAVAQGKS